MRIKIGDTGRSFRLFEKVATVDEQYDICDLGIEHADGGIDSLVVGGSFYSLKNAITKADEDARLSHQAAVATAQCVKTPVAPVAPKEPVPVVNYDGVEQDIAGL